MIGIDPYDRLRKLKRFIQPVAAIPDVKLIHAYGLPSAGSHGIVGVDLLHGCRIRVGQRVFLAGRNGQRHVLCPVGHHFSGLTHILPVCFAINLDLERTLLDTGKVDGCAPVAVGIERKHIEAVGDEIQNRVIVRAIVAVDILCLPSFELAVGTRELIEYFVDRIAEADAAEGGYILRGRIDKLIVFHVCDPDHFGQLWFAFTFAAIPEVIGNVLAVH